MDSKFVIAIISCILALPCLFFVSYQLWILTKEMKNDADTNDNPDFIYELERYLLAIHMVYNRSIKEGLITVVKESEEERKLIIEGRKYLVEKGYMQQHKDKNE